MLTEVGTRKEMYPDHEFPGMYGRRLQWARWLISCVEPPPNEGHDMSAGRVTARPRAEELLQWIHDKGFRPMDESLRELGDYLEKDYKANTES